MQAEGTYVACVGMQSAVPCTHARNYAVPVPVPVPAPPFVIFQRPAFDRRLDEIR